MSISELIQARNAALKSNYTADRFTAAQALERLKYYQYQPWHHMSDKSTLNDSILSFLAAHGFVVWLGNKVTLTDKGRKEI